LYAFPFDEEMTTGLIGLETRISGKALVMGVTARLADPARRVRRDSPRFIHGSLSESEFMKVRES